MSHDFGIRNKKKKNWAWFFGFANGLMYRAFHEEKHFAVFSGDNGMETKSKEETENALDWAIDTFDHMGYPDPTRLDEIKKFRKEMSNDNFNDTYEIWYS